MPDQRRRLLGRLHYLCAIHAYADGHRRQAVAYTWRAALGVSLKYTFVLLIRCILGVRVVNASKN